MTLGFEPLAEATYWVYDILEKNGYKMLHIMGNTDALVTLPGAWKWIKDRKFKVTSKWTPALVDG